MAAPSFLGNSNGNTDAASPGIISMTGSPSTGLTDNVFIAQILQDGATDYSPLTTDWSSLGDSFAALDGTVDSATYIGSFAGGGCWQHLYIGRMTTENLGADPAVSGYASQDIYCRMYFFADVNAGTTLADVIEQNGTTTPATTSGTSNTIADAGVITTGADRLALNLVDVNDDNAVGAFTGMTGGTWAEAVAEYATASGTDGCIQLQTAAMATAGTIDGGTYTMAASDGWGSVGFALIGTTPGVAVPRSPGIDSGNAHFCKAWQAVRKWKHGSHGIMVPDIMFAQQGG